MHRKRWRHVFYRLLRAHVWASIAVLAGCTIQQAPASRAVAIPEVWQLGQTEPNATMPREWWRGFGSPELDALVAQALERSLDIDAAIARVEQAEARARIAGAPLWPQLNATADINREGSLGGNRATQGNAYNAAFVATYELDLWGRYRAERDAARKDLLAARLDQDVARLTVAASVVTVWLKSRELQERIVIAERNLANAERVLRLVEARARSGAALQLELAQQRALVAAQRRTIPALRQQEEAARTALAALLAEPAPVTLTAPVDLGALQVPLVAADLPSTLLERRPDIAAAEARLAAGDANLNAARAAMFPSVTLGAGLGVSRLQVGTLFEGPIYTLAAALTAPIFQGGRLAGTRDLAAAERHALLTQYRKTIIDAFADVEVALSAARGTDAEAQEQHVELEETRRATQLSEARYRAGADTLLVLLDSQRAFYAAQDQAVRLLQARLQARVMLYRAFGGGFTDSVRN